MKAVILKWLVRCSFPLSMLLTLGLLPGCRGRNSPSGAGGVIAAGDPSPPPVEGGEIGDVRLIGDVAPEPLVLAGKMPPPTAKPESDDARPLAGVILPPDESIPPPPKGE